MAQIPSSVAAVLEELTANLPRLLGRNSVGLYVYGSLTQRAFNRSRSDIDCIAVTQRDLSEAQFRKLGNWLEKSRQSNQSISRLQMSILIRDNLLTMDARCCHYQFGPDGQPRSCPANRRVW
jgi:hypothetical protein